MSDVLIKGKKTCTVKKKLTNDKKKRTYSGPNDASHGRLGLLSCNTFMLEAGCRCCGQ